MILIIVFCYSCNTNNSKNYLYRFCEKNQQFYFDTSFNSAYLSKATRQYVNLKSYDAPSDTFCLTVEHFNDTSFRLFEYKFIDSIASYKSYVFPMDKFYNQILFDKNFDDPEKFSQIYKPSLSNTDFIAELENNKILTLPDYRSIKNYPKEFTDIYTVQFSSKCVFRSVSFSRPQLFRAKFTEAENLASFLDFLKKEFNFKL